MHCGLRKPEIITGLPSPVKDWQIKMADADTEKRIILASGSPYRKELLSRLQLPFHVAVPDIDETPRQNELPEATGLRLAEQKARFIGEKYKNAIIIGSDQVATCDQIQIGKPGNHQNALAQLQMMRGKKVIFHSALCVYQNFQPDLPVQTANVRTTVTFCNLPDAELDAYLRIEQPYDCAGSAKNEGLGIALLERIESSDPTALTGLPLIALTAMLRKIGVAFFVTALMSGCVVAPAPYHYRAEVIYPEVALPPVVTIVAPPPPQIEVVGMPPVAGYFWVSGVWVWEGGQHVWHPGRWQAPKPGYVWIPYQWRQTGNEWQLSGGYWQRN